MDTNGDAHAQITTRLENSMRQLRLELAAQGLDVAQINGGWRVDWVDGEPSIKMTAAVEAAPNSPEHRK